MADAGGATATAIEAIRHHGDVAAYTGKLSVAQEHFDEATRRVRKALEEGGDRQLLSHLAGVELASSRNQRLLDNVEASLVSARQAAAVYSSLATAEPEKMEWQMSQASAASGVGMALARKGKLEEARDQYLGAVEALKKALEREPNNSRTKRELMLAWSRVGDVEGSPTSLSMGNRVKALAAYGEMTKIAEELLAADGDDQRALGDLGIARMRVAAVTDGAARLDRFREAIYTIGQALEKNPKNHTMRMNFAYTQWQYGIALKDEKRTAEALANWREAAANARAILSTQQGNVARLLMESLGRIAVTLREAGQDATATEAEIAATAAREKAGTMSGDVNRAKAALIGMEIALAGGPRPQAEVAKLAAGVKTAWDKVRGKPGWQSSSEKDYMRFVALCRAGKTPGSNHRVTREEKQLVQHSFEALHDVAQPMVMLFYGRLFELDPSLRGMFKTPMKEQAGKLVATLLVAVDCLDNLETLKPKLRELGKHHGDLGVEARHYALVEQALVWAITRALEGGCSAAIREAWQKLLRTISGEMMAGAG